MSVDDKDKNRMDTSDALDEKVRIISIMGNTSDYLYCNVCFNE